MDNVTLPAKRENDEDRIILVAIFVISSIIAFLQILFLRGAALPGHDEGVYVEAGRMMWEGLMPYRDFSYMHGPVFPLILGTGFQLTHSMFLLRFIFVLLTCFSAIPLYQVIQRITKDRLAAMFSVIFFLTYYEVMRYGTRFIAERPFLTVLIIIYLYFGIVRPKGWFAYACQLSSAILVFFSHYQSAILLLLFSIAIISTERAPRAIYRYFSMGAIVSIIFIAFITLFPNSFQSTILDHFQKIQVLPLTRTQRLIPLISGYDAVFYFLSVSSLILTVATQRKWRIWALAMLTIIFSTLLPREYYVHYHTFAALAYTMGCAFFILLLREAKKIWMMFPAVEILAFSVLTMRLTIVLPPLVNDWLWLRLDPTYYQIVNVLKTLPEPILTFKEPIYAIDSNKKIVQYYWRATARSYPRPPEKELDMLAQQACTIFLPKPDQQYLPKSLLEKWANNHLEIKRFQNVRIFLSTDSRCLQKGVN